VDSKYISADSHVNEPPDLWTKGVPDHLAGLVPTMVELEAGDAWVVAPNTAPRPISFSAAAGAKPEEITSSRITYSSMRAGAFLADARLEDQDIDGLSGEVLYPGLGRSLHAMHNQEVRAYAARAYNDWILEYESIDRNRLIGLAVLPPIDDEGEGEKELRRIASLGLRGAYLAVVPNGLPLSHPSGAGLWEAAEALDIPISLHVGAGQASGFGMSGVAGQTADPVPGVRESFLSAVTMSINPYISTLIFSGLMDRHPGLRVVIAESGIGWIPYFLERMESVCDKQAKSLGTTLERRPSEIFRSQFYATFQEDVSGIALRHSIGVGQIMWATDYPHSETTWPNSMEAAKKTFADVSEDETRRIVADNCRELYKLDAQ
jgi:uncharacterized protein